MDPSRRRNSREFAAPQGAVSEERLRAYVPPAASGQFPLRHTQVRGILLRYLSPILVDSVLNKAMQERRLTPATLSEADLNELTSDIMIGLRLFVDEASLPRLMLELAEFLDVERL